MKPPDRKLFLIVAIAGAVAVGLGAFGAHVFQPRWESALGKDGAAYRIDVFRRAEFYHFVHVLALFALAAGGAAARFKWPVRLWLAGIVLFSGSLYALALTGMKVLGAITPLGGLAFIAGWIMLALPSRAED